MTDYAEHTNLFDPMPNRQSKSDRFYDTLDRVTTPVQQLTMEDRSDVLRQLRELISALDNRVPQIQRAGEVDIAHDAAVFKEKALARIAELESRHSDTLDH